MDYLKRTRLESVYSDLSVDLLCDSFKLPVGRKRSTYLRLEEFCENVWDLVTCAEGLVKDRRLRGERWFDGSLRYDFEFNSIVFRRSRNVLLNFFSSHCSDVRDKYRIEVVDFVNCYDGTVNEIFRYFSRVPSVLSEAREIYSCLDEDIRKEWSEHSFVFDSEQGVRDFDSYLRCKMDTYLENVFNLPIFKKGD